MEYCTFLRHFKCSQRNLAHTFYSMSFIFPFICSIFVLASCEKIETPVSTISGYAQKGYLVEGSEVKAIAYDDNMRATGEEFIARTSGCLGAFSIDVRGSNASYYELKAEGRYFDETTGLITDSPICLGALVKSSDAKVNLNLLTTITSGRIKKLVSSGKNYTKAKTQAQVEFFTTVNLVGADIDFTRMDLTGGSDADAMLLLTTCAIQYGRSASELTTILDNTAKEFEKDGTLSENTCEALFQPGSDLDFEVVFDNLKRYYDENGLSKESLPSYWKYFYLDENATLAIISIDGFMDGRLVSESPEAFSGTFKVVSIEPFTVSTDVDWITFEKRELEKEVYEVEVHVAENKTYERRIGHIMFCDSNSKEIKRREFGQGQAFPDIDPKISLKGKGIPGDPFLIECLDDLLYMRDVYNRTSDRFITSRTNCSKVNASGAIFKLTSDIDLSSVCGPDKGDWIPIGMFQDGDYDFEMCGFDGTFIGSKDDGTGYPLSGPGYTISGLYINNDNYYQGLFGILKGGVWDLIIEGDVSGKSYVGLLAGETGNNFNLASGHSFDIRFRDIATRGSVSSESESGGIVGRINGGIISDCVNYADVTATLTAGGIAGHSRSGISNCKNYGSITGTSPNMSSIGGIVGSTQWISIWDCANYGKVSGSYDVGGIVGHTYSQEVTWGNRVNSYIVNCYNNGDIRLILNNQKYNYNKHRSAGGIVGFVDGSFFSVRNCYSSGIVSFEEGIDNEYIGGICGEIDTSSSHIIEYNYLLQEGIPAIGGERDVKGDVYGKNIVENCFRLSLEQMKGAESYNGVLYKNKTGKSFNTLIGSLNAFLEDNKDNLPRMHLWEYTANEPYPVLSENSYTFL